MMSRFPTHRALLALLALLAGCTTTSLKQAPIVDRSERRTAPTAGIAAAPGVSAPREARDGSYVVQRGDTLFSIALAFGLDYRDLARWNNLDDPSRLQVGQALRVQPPADSPGGAAVAAVPVAPVPAAEVRPLDAPQGSTTPAAPAGATGPGSIGSAPSVAPAAGVPSAQIPVPEVKPAAPAIADSGLTWIWPVSGKIVEGFDESRNKGIDIAGNEGDPVHAAGDGQVVYRGNGLRGYGNLVIIKHTDEFISAYAHNRQILVEQGQTVKRGQRIAEMGKSDADAPKLHFEVSRQGKPVDPLKYLPAR